jgi:hypothetical protein
MDSKYHKIRISRISYNIRCVFGTNSASQGKKPYLVPGLLSIFDFMWPLFHRLEGKASDEEVFAHSPKFYYIFCRLLAGLEIGDV